MIKLESSVQFELLRLLSLMFVVWTHVDMQVSENRSTECVLWQHATNCILDQSKWLALQLLDSSALSLASRITCVSDVFLLLPLISSQNHFLCIDNNYEVSAVCVWCKIRLVLSAQSLCNFGCQSAQSLAFSINEQPLLVGVLLIDGAGFVAQSIHSSVF